MSIFSNKIGILLAVMIFGLTYGLSAPLIAIRLVNEGYSEIFVGINAAMHAVGVFIIAPFLPSLCRRINTKSLIIFHYLSHASYCAYFPSRLLQPGLCCALCWGHERNYVGCY